MNLGDTHKQASTEESKAKQLIEAAKLIKARCTEEECWQWDEVANEKTNICPFHKNSGCIFTQLATEDDDPRYPEEWDI